VQSTVRDAHDRDYEVYVLEDACAAATEPVHQSSMELLDEFHPSALSLI
jgi:biuret amidohydrolase